MMPRGRAAPGGRLSFVAEFKRRNVHRMAGPSSLWSASASSRLIHHAADRSPGKDQGYFADGIAEELLSLLAKIPELRVSSRFSAFSFKGQDIEVPESPGA